MSEAREYVRMGLEYAERVAAGVIPAAAPARQACERQLRDMDRWRSKDSPFRFDERKAARVCRFVELMPHIKGRWARERGSIVLEAWQAFILICIFGWVRTVDNLRRFRQVYIEMPRKNAKSTLTSAIAGYMLAADGEEGAEVYSAATTRDQAGIVFRDTLAMVRKSPDLCRALGVKYNSFSIFCPDTNSRMMPLSSQDHRLDGLNPSFAILDELHAMAGRGLYDVLDTAMAARSQPLLWMITTAGSNQAGVCYEQHKYVRRILTGNQEDESYFGIIYTIDETDDWQTPEAWRKANPNYGISVDPQDLERQALKAGAVPAALAAFKTKRLCVWVHADSAWLDLLSWARCSRPGLKMEQFTGAPCYIGLDLASRNDIAAAAVLFPLEEIPDAGQGIALFGRYWLPEETVARDETGNYEGWVKSGQLIATEGAMTDMDVIIDDLVDWVSRFEVRGICFDPWQANPLLSALQKRGVTVPLVEVRQTTENFSPAMKELEAMIGAGLVQHDGGEVLTWMMGNVVCHRDARDNVYPRKDAIANKIDGAIASFMPMHRYLADFGGPSKYEQEGLLSV